MSEQMKATLKIGAVYFGTVLGAGFASGQEILTFFGRFGKEGLLGIIAAGALFIVIAAVILNTAYTRGLHRYHDLLTLVLPRPLVPVFSIIITLFLAVTYITMLSGSGILLEERFGVPRLAGILITSVVCCIVFIGSLKGVAIVNSILTPLMACGMIVISFLLLNRQDVATFAPAALSPGKNSIVSAIVYVGFNILTASVMLVNLRELIPSRRVCLSGSLFGGGLLLLCSLMVYLVLMRFSGAAAGELPMFALSARLGVFAYNLYGLVLFMAMLSTAVSVGFSFLNNITAGMSSYRLLCLGFCVLAIPFSMIPFSILVNTLYTFFGCLGFVLIFFILLYGIRGKQI